MNRESEKSLSEQRILLNIDRWVMGGVLISLLWKIPFFFVGFSVYRQLPLADDFFPAVLQNTFVYLALYLTGIFCCTFVFLTRDALKLLWIKLILSVSLFLLCIHQQTYNDVTFLTCFWTSIWSTWFSICLIKGSVVNLREKGAFFAHLIISLVFFGGAVGKMTSGYWNGNVFFEIYFEGRNFWLFNILRDQLSEVQLRSFATWHSRLVIVAESVCSLLWLLPSRWASILAIVTLLGIGCLSNFLLFSVVSCLIGLAIVGFYSPKRTADVNV